MITWDIGGEVVVDEEEVVVDEEEVVVDEEEVELVETTGGGFSVEV
jgi:hypothetical protein